MAQLLHGSARTTQAVRRSIQRGQESLQTLAQRHGLDPKTVAKWRKRVTTQDARMGPIPTFTVLTAAEEAIAVTFRQHTLLPLEDCLYTLQATVRTQWQMPPVIFTQNPTHLTLGLCI